MSDRTGLKVLKRLGHVESMSGGAVDLKSVRV